MFVKEKMNSIWILVEILRKYSGKERIEGSFFNVYGRSKMFFLIFRLMLIFWMEICC